jgi:hypothetical protein
MNSMRRFAVISAVLAAACLALTLETAWAADAPADRVVAMYFHRTQRCPTCLLMGSYSEEAVTTGFAQQIEKGKVAFYYIDFQDPKNTALTNGYGVSGPTLIVAKIAGSKVAQYRNLQEICEKSHDKAAFIEYVQSNVRQCLK